MKTTRVISLFLARLCLSMIFLIGGYENLVNWHETEKELMENLCEWQSHLTFFSESVQDCLAVLVPWSSLILIVGTFFELLGAVMLLCNYRERLGVALLILFLLPTTIMAHSFWFLEGPPHDLQMTFFFQNLAILGGLILVATNGTDARGDDGVSLSSMHIS